MAAGGTADTTAPAPSATPSTAPPCWKRRSFRAPFMTWGEPGPGSWITLYANRQHVYAVIAGLRWDTGGDAPGVTGPRWHAEPFSAKGFVVRHPPGY